MAQITNCDNIIDSRDIIARIEELEGERQSFVDALEEIENSADEEFFKARAELDAWDESEEAEELKALQEFAEEASQYSGDWTYGETLINESYWVDYCREMVSDIGDMPREIPSYIVIDWDATAENLREDYATVSFDGTDFYIRNS